MTDRSRRPPAAPGDPPDTYVFGDPIPVPDATEKSSETAWGLFSELSATQDLRYADTVPLTVAGAAVPPRPGAKPVKLLADLLPQRIAPDAVLSLARQTNRVCPQPAHWQQLHDLLAACRAGPSTDAPMTPITGTAWRETPELAKRMCLRSQIEWASSHGCLAQAHAFLKQLREEDWHHISR
jgi:hypothetical protein